MTPQSVSKILGAAGHPKTKGKQLTHLFVPGFLTQMGASQEVILVRYVESMAGSATPETDQVEQDHLDRYQKTLEEKGFRVTREKFHLVVQQPETATYWRVGFAPYHTIPGPVFEDRRQCLERARQEIRYGGYRGWALKPYRCDQNGNLILPKGRG